MRDFWMLTPVIEPALINTRQVNEAIDARRQKRLNIGRLVGIWTGKELLRLHPIRAADRPAITGGRY